MLRVLLPSWRFFDDSAGSPRLLLRTAASDADFGPWRALAFTRRSALQGSTGLDTPTGSPRARRVQSGFARAPEAALRLLFHPLAGLRLAQYTLVEHLLAELAELDPSLAPDVTALVSYRLVLRLVERELASSVERELASSVERALASSVERELASSVERALASSVEREPAPSGGIEYRLRFQFKVTLFDERTRATTGLDGSLAHHDASSDGGEDLLVSSIHTYPTARLPP